MPEDTDYRKNRTPETIAEHDFWIGRFNGHFGEPLWLEAYRKGEISFRELYTRNLRYAENLLAEVQSINSVAFEGADDDSGK